MKLDGRNFLQSKEYAKMNEILGAKVIREEFFGEEVVMIVRDAKRGRYLEVPAGPLIDFKDKKKVTETVERLKRIGKAEKCVFVRIRPQLLNSAENLMILERAGLKKSPMHLAAEHTVILDLEKNEDALLSEMRRQTRYEVRRAEKLGVRVSRDDTEEIFRDFHAVQVETAKRQNFIPPDLKTLLAEREAFAPKIKIYRAETATGEAIAYGLVIWNGEEGEYYEAASTDLNRKLPGAYALIWQAAKDLKKAGVKRFNLWGIAPKGQPNHRYAGVTTFKTGFGGEIVEYVPAHDLVISRFRYLVNLIVETSRRKRRHL